MVNFGWSYPAGCTGTPYDEASACDITKYCERLPAGVVGVYWDEDGNIQEAHIVNADYPDGKGGDVTVREQAYTTIGAFDWNDELSDEQNFVAAAEEYARLIGIGTVKKLKEAFGDYESPYDLYRKNYKYTDRGPIVGFLVRMTVGATDLEAGPNLQPFDQVVDKWHYCEETYGLRTWDDMISAGVEVLAISVSSIVEGCDEGTGTEVIELTGSESPDEIRKRFYDAVDAINAEANSIWNQTHGCPECARHWLRAHRKTWKGADDPRWQIGDTPIWDKCRGCEGAGTII